MKRAAALLAFFLLSLTAFAIWPFTDPPRGVFRNQEITHAGSIRTKADTVFDFRKDGTVIYSRTVELTAPGSEPFIKADNDTFRWRMDGNKIQCYKGDVARSWFVWEDNDLLLYGKDRYVKDK